MLTRFCLILGLTAAAGAQQTVAPTTPAQVGSPRGDNKGDYNVTQSFEVGYRFAEVDGDVGMYRSVVNFGNGPRLLGANLTVNSRDGHGHYFDEILLHVLGLGNDPYQNVMLRVQKNRLYRYDMLWRLDDYYNPALPIAGNYGLTLTGMGPGAPLIATQGLHAFDTERRLQDHDLTLFPQSHYRFHAGYSRNSESGPALSTAQEFNATGDGFPVFTDVRRQWNEYRLGSDIEVAGFRFTVTRRWDFFKDDTPYTSAGIAAAATPADQTVLIGFNRAYPLHGANPGWLGNLFTRRKRWAANARITYVSGSRDFLMAEAASGINQFGGPGSRQIAAGGNASRPDLAGDAALQFFPTDKLTIVNNSSVLSNRIDGQSSYSEVQNGLDLGQTIYFRYLGIRMVTNSTTVNYQVNKKLGFFTGYNYSDRLIRTIDASTLPAFANSTVRNTYQVSNHLNSVDAGFRYRPWKPFTITADGEIGRANYPLTPISPKNYHSINGRMDYRARRLQLSATYRQLYNLNAPFVFATFDSHSRQYSANGTWVPKDWFSIDASYVKLHLDTRGGIAFFVNTGNRPQLVSNLPSYYISNVHAGNLGVRFAIRRRADLYVGYSINRDTGDGRPSAVPAGVTNPVEALLDSVQTFPLTYQSPLARVSIRITEKVRWNVGWQLYNYSQQFNPFGFYQNFHANTGFSSILWSF
jgi:hypothetical protein